MILINGSPAAINTASWPPLARDIFERKKASPYVFNYSSLRHLQTEMLLRAEIVRAARELEASGMEFATFEHARANEIYWRLTPLGGFQLRENVRPSDAIRDIFRNGYLYASECATAIPIVYYKAVLEFIGEAQFNRLFQDLLLYSWNTDSDLGLIQERVDVERAVPGDVLYFDNPDHHPAMPEWQGVNVVMLDDDVYYGHGVGIASGMEIIRGLNMRRRFFSFRSAYLMDLIVYPDFQYLSRFMPGTSTGALSGVSGGSAVPSGIPTSSPGMATAPPMSGFPTAPPIVQPWSASSLPADIPPPLLTSQQVALGVQPPGATGQVTGSQRSPALPIATPPRPMPPWLSLPPISASRDGYSYIRARVGRRRYVC